MNTPRFILRKSMIGMIHVGALPGTPKYAGNMAAIVAKAKEEAKIFADCGLHAIAIENMHDTPYVNKRVGPEVVAAMSVVASEIKNVCKLPCGIQILAGANCEAMAVALAADLDFVRAEGFVFAHVADEGIIESCAGELLRYRKMIGAEHVAVFCDIKKKHCSHSITQDVDIGETAKAAEFFLSDGVIVTGVATGAEADLADIRAVRAHCNLPVLVGSGVTTANVEKYLPEVDGIIVGSFLKEKGYWANPVDPRRVEDLMKKVRALGL
jgi:membrane complex biogenesis BtpA family protein